MSFLKASMIVGLFMLLGRTSGFIRELIISSIGGASPKSDVIIILFTFPDLILNLFLSGGLTAALVPTFRNLPAAAIALGFRITLIVGVYFSILALFIAFFSSNVLGLLAPGWSEKISSKIQLLFSVLL